MYMFTSLVILGTRNKITDLLMILAWASPFNLFILRSRARGNETQLQFDKK